MVPSHYAPTRWNPGPTLRDVAAEYPVPEAGKAVRKQKGLNYCLMIHSEKAGTMVFLSVCLVLPMGFSSGESGADVQTSPPNILFVMSDDHAYHQLGVAGNPLIHTPNLDRLAHTGVFFENAFCTNSLCAPARATVLTGCLSNVNGISGNSEGKGRIEQIDPDLPTFPMLLQEAGYQTGIVGKWHLPHEPRGFDFISILPGQGLYMDPEFIQGGNRIKRDGYVTDIITEMALDYLSRVDREKPFCLIYQHKGPHRPFTPAPRHTDLYQDGEIPFPETFYDNFETRLVAGKASDMRLEESLERDYPDLPPGLSDNDKKRWIYQRFVKDHYRAIQSIDEGLGRVLDHLEEEGLRENTLIVYTSDNGFFLGEYGWYDKRFMYEPSLRIPLLVSFPKRVASGQVINHMIMNIDYAPTILDFAGVAIPGVMQGESLKPLLLGRDVEWRDHIYYSYYENTWAMRAFEQSQLSDPSFNFFTAHRIGPHRGIRDDRHKLIRYYSEQDYWELFDLQKDPLELNNVYQDPDYANVVRRMTAQLSETQRLYKDVNTWEKLTLPDYN